MYLWAALPTGMVSVLVLRVMLMICSGSRWWNQERLGSLESDTTEQLHFHFSLSCIGEGNGNPLHCSCLENPRHGAAWWAAICGFTQSRTWLKRLSSSSSITSLDIRDRSLSFSFIFFQFMVRSLPAMQETKVWSLCQEEPLEMGRIATPILPWEFHGKRSLEGSWEPKKGNWHVHGIAESDMTEQLTCLVFFLKMDKCLVIISQLLIKILYV